MSGPEFHPPPPEGEEVPAHRVLLVLAGVMALFILTVWATLPLAGWGKLPGSGTSSVPEGLGRAEVGIVNQKPFPLDTRAQDKRARARQQLSTYGWVDRQGGTIHVPVERAVELLLQQEQGGRP